MPAVQGRQHERVGCQSWPSPAPRRYGPRSTTPGTMTAPGWRTGSKRCGRFRHARCSASAPGRPMAAHVFDQRQVLIQAGGVERHQARQPRLAGQMRGDAAVFGGAEGDCRRYGPGPPRRMQARRIQTWMELTGWRSTSADRRDDFEGRSPHALSYPQDAQCAAALSSR